MQKRETIKKVLMRRDGLSEDEAQNLVDQAREDLFERLENEEMPFDLCQEHFGLEPDYLDELML
jgi:hypothetical protein